MAASRCYHPNLAGPEAEALLHEKGFEGSFLIRPSRNNPGDYSLSVKRSDKIIHVRIQNQGEYYDLYGGEKFATLSELIEYYTENPDRLKQTDGSFIHLIHPMYYEGVHLTDRWYHSRIDGKMAESQLLSRGKVGSYLVRNSQSSPGSYVLSVHTCDEVTHIMINANGRGRFHINKDIDFATPRELISYYLEHPLKDAYDRPVILSLPFVSTSFIPTSITERVSELEKPSGSSYNKSGFFEEFEELQNLEYSARRDRKEGMKLSNRPKNRFKNIIPYDETIVVLRDPPVPGETYINASYIDGEVPGSEKSYIATQGCLKSTAGDFWHMVWQEGSRIIVMITKEMERNREKCFRYWPSGIDESVTFGEVVVRLVTEKSQFQYVMRHLRVKKGEEREKSIYHYQYKSWPDHGVPQDPSLFLGFMEDINLQTKELSPDPHQKPPPTIVHCSAGIGRTGTYITADILVKLIEHQGWSVEIDIHHTVKKLRKSRSGMVQTDNQYKFVYQVVQYYVQGTKTCIKETPTSDDLVYGNVDILPFVSPIHRAMSTSREASPVKAPPKPPRATK